MVARARVEISRRRDPVDAAIGSPLRFAISIPDILDSMKSHLLSFLCGAALVLGITAADTRPILPQASAAGPNRVYELRVYHAATGKLDALNARFRDHVDGLFRHHNMKSIGYWVPQENPDNLLIYVLEHPSRAEADKNWDAFQKDPDWMKVKAETEVNGVLAQKVDRTYMNPTEFSKLK
jgi:hypothetical protein